MGIIIRVLLIAYGVWVGYHLRADIDQLKEDNKLKKERKLKNKIDEMNRDVFDVTKHL